MSILTLDDILGHDSGRPCPFDVSDHLAPAGSLGMDYIEAANSAPIARPGSSLLGSAPSVR